MHAPTPRIFTPSRIAALALIAVLASGLAYLRFAPDSDVSVPEGAKAGDVFLERGEFAGYEADRGTLVVPENRADAQSRLIALPIVRIRALSDHPAEPIFRLHGGPGLTNIQFPGADRYVDDHDLVLVGYRGVDGSSVLDCPEVVSALKHSRDLLGEKSFRAYGDGFRSCADRLTDEGVDLDGYTLAQRVDDLEAARKALGYDRINLVSESVGTRTALIYSWRYPTSINRSVMIGANPPGHYIWDGKTTDAQIARYAELCANDDTCSKRTDDLAASMRRTAADIPDHWWFLPIKRGNVLAASFYGLHESTMENAPLASPMTFDAWLSAADGDASGFWLMSFAADLAFPTAFVWGEMAATAHEDAAVAKRYLSSDDRDSILDDAGTEFTWGGGRLADAWPTAPDHGEYNRIRTSNVETLLVGGTLDVTTPPQVARKELLPYLPNGRQVLLDGFGHTFDFWTYQPEANARLINTYLASGEVDTSLYKRQRVDFTPEVTDTALAKGFAGTMIGLAILTIVSLLLMARRVRRRGGFGRKASATLRSVYPVVLGLGGWFVGVLVVITTTPGVPIDNELLAAISIGAPVGLGVYLAWVNRDQTAKAKTAGFAAAVAGAFAGAWFGFNATEGLLAVITTVVGATVGANAFLLALDIASERQARLHSAPATATLEARPSTG